MAKAHYCRCRVNLAGQGCHIVIYDEHNPETWPEVQVLQQLHGTENVMDIMPIALTDIVPSREKDRLVAEYGYRVVETVFPGRTFRMEGLMTDDDQLPQYIDGQINREGDNTPEVDEAEIERLAAAAPVFKPGRAPRVARE